jgi:hypothetical protein
MKANYIFDEDWKVLIKFFPASWTVMSRKTGAFTRNRKIKSVKILLRLLLIHLVEGCSLRETSAIAKASGLCDISDVGILKRLRYSSEWFRWMSVELLKNFEIKGFLPPRWLADFNVKSVDASVITEPGSTGSDWRLHYNMNLYNLQCEEFVITGPSKGESFKNFKVLENDLLIGDRAYGRLAGFEHVIKNGGNYIARMKKDAFWIRTEDDEKADIIKLVKHLKYGETADLNVEGYTKKGLSQKMRLCILRKSKLETEKAVKLAKRRASRSQYKLKPETLEYCKYFIIATSLGDEISAKKILDLYRFRWQVEIAFKRLKGILGLGHLPKKDEDSCKAWLHGKMFIALLSQIIVEEGRKISPWGYSL